MSALELGAPCGRCGGKVVGPTPTCVECADTGGVDGLTHAARVEFERIEDSGETQGLASRVDQMVADRIRSARERERALWAESASSALQVLRAEAAQIRGRLATPQYGDTERQVLLDRAHVYRILAAIEVLG